MDSDAVAEKTLSQDSETKDRPRGDSEKSHSVLGKSVAFKGDLHAEEDLFIQYFLLLQPRQAMQAKIQYGLRLDRRQPILAIDEAESLLQRMDTMAGVEIRRTSFSLALEKRSTNASASCRTSARPKRPRPGGKPSSRARPTRCWPPLSRRPS